MVTYPIQIKRDTYQGSDPKKRAKAQTSNQIASQLESLINEMLKTQVEPIRVYTYLDLASQTGIDYEIVRNLCFSIHSGNGGVIAYKRGMPQEQAMDQAAKGN